MGWKTYHQVVTELSPKEWVYEGLTSYVVTHREIPSADQIIFTHQPPRELVRDLKEKPGKNIWICGGDPFVSRGFGRRGGRNSAAIAPRPNV